MKNVLKAIDSFMVEDINKAIEAARESINSNPVMAGYLQKRGLMEDFQNHVIAEAYALASEKTYTMDIVKEFQKFAKQNNISVYEFPVDGRRFFSGQLL